MFKAGKSLSAWRKKSACLRHFGADIVPDVGGGGGHFHQAGDHRDHDHGEDQAIFDRGRPATITPQARASTAFAYRA